MSLLHQVLFFAVPVAYLGAAGLFGIEFRGGEKRYRTAARSVLFAGVLLHALLIATDVYRLKDLPLGGVSPFLSLLAFSVVLVELYLGAREQDGSTGLFLVGLAAILAMVGAAGPVPAEPVVTKAHPAVFGIHVGAAILGYTAAAIAAIHGLLYLFLYHQIKTSHFGRFYKRLPPLMQIDLRVGRSMGLSFVALTISLVFGMRALRRTVETYWIWDAKIVSTLVMWVFFGATLASRRFLGWGGRRSAWLSLAAFLLALLSLGVVSPLLSRFHDFPR